MYITSYVDYKQKERHTRLSRLAKLFNKEPIKIKINPIYIDVSYNRKRTRFVQPEQIDKRIRDYIATMGMLGHIALDYLNNNVVYLTTHYNILYDTESRRADLDQKSLYNTFTIPKASGGYRTIDAPNEELKKLMYVLKAEIERLQILPHDAAYAYVPFRDCRKAIKRHQDNKSCWFLKVDLKDFFGSCSPGFVEAQLKKVYPLSIECPFNTKLLEYIRDIAYLDNKLPQGTPLSPMLTNLVMVPIDYEISKQLPKEFVYTRYADDILISSRTSFNYKEIVKLLEDILKDTPLKVNDKKTRYGSKNGRNFNLGIMYNKDMELTVGHNRKRKLKAMVHTYVNTPREERVLQDVRVLLGELSYLHNIEPEYYEKILNYFNKKYKYDIIKDIIATLKYN